MWLLLVSHGLLRRQSPVGSGAPDAVAALKAQIAAEDRAADSRHGHCPKLCTVGSATVLACGNSRQLVFGDHTGTETVVRCLSSPCSGFCGDCPCDFDAGPLTEAYMQTIFDQLRPVCGEAAAKVLMVGLGGGELPQYVVRNCPGVSVEAVELNGDVIELAQRYFGLQQTLDQFPGRLAVEKTDGLAGVRERAGGGYDAVVVDCFTGHGRIPEQCRDAEMAHAAQQALKPAGLLLQNMWHTSDGYPEVATNYKAALETYRSVFASVESLAVPAAPLVPDWVNIVKAVKA